MLDGLIPYDIHFIQKASPSSGDAFDFSYIYKFRTERTNTHQSLKYIIRVEAVGDVLAIKFYAARDRKMDNKYNRILKTHSYSEALRIFLTCASIVPLMLKIYPQFSFVINGAQSMDLDSGKIEDKVNNQRFRIYSYIATHIFGDTLFEHYGFPNISSYLIINRNGCRDVSQKQQEIKERFLKIYDIDI